MFATSAHVMGRDAPSLCKRQPSASTAKASAASVCVSGLPGQSAGKTK